MARTSDEASGLNDRGTVAVTISESNLAGEEKPPLVDSDVIQGEYYSPTEGPVSGVTASAASRSGDRTGSVVRHIHVNEDVALEGSEVNSVVTEHGLTECNEIVIATAIWARQLGVTLPVTPFDYQYLFTEPLEDLAGSHEDVTDEPVDENYRAVSGEKSVGYSRIRINRSSDIRTTRGTSGPTVMRTVSARTITNRSARIHSNWVATTKTASKGRSTSSPNTMGRPPRRKRRGVPHGGNCQSVVAG